MITAMFENMPCKLNDEVQLLLTFLLDALNHRSTLSHPSKTFQSMLLQAFSMSFTYNPMLVLQHLYQTNQMAKVFEALFSFKDNFKKNFEIRKIILGFIAIIEIPEEDLPPLLKQLLPNIMDYLIKLTIKLYKQRLDVIFCKYEHGDKFNEEYYEFFDVNYNYASRMDGLEELQILKDALQGIKRQSPELYLRM